VTLPPASYLPVNVPDGARCAVHAERQAAFACGRCGNFACGDCFHPGLEGQPFCSACADFASGEIPLEKRAELGLPRAFVKTTIGVLLEPWEFFAARSRESSLVPPFLFAMSFGAAAGIVSAIGNMLTVDAQLAELRNNPALRGNPLLADGWLEAFYSPAGQLGLAVFNFVFYPLYYVILAGLQWVAHWVVGARGATYREVLRAILYLQTTSALLLFVAPASAVLSLVSPQLAGLPALPFLLYLLVWLVIAMWKVQRTELWRPVVAQGLLMIFCCCLPTILLTFGMIALVASFFPR